MFRELCQTVERKFHTDKHRLLRRQTQTATQTNTECNLFKIKLLCLSVPQSAFVCVKFALNGLTQFSKHSQFFKETRTSEKHAPALGAKTSRPIRAGYLEKRAIQLFSKFGMTHVSRIFSRQVLQHILSHGVQIELWFPAPIVAGKYA